MPVILLAALAWAASTSVWKGVYTEAQAERGHTAYTASCSGCHQPGLNGYGNLLIGDKFMEHWREDNAGSFYHVMKTTMPRGGAASLSDQAYLDIFAFILQTNGFPAGKTELRLDTLKNVRIEGENGPAPVPEFSLVKTVGCLVHEGSEWKLLHASAAMRTREPHDGSVEDLKADATLSGKDVVKFLRLADYDVDRFHMETQVGHRVEAKGFLILKDGGKTLNLTSVATVAVNCEYK